MRWVGGANMLQAAAFHPIREIKSYKCCIFRRFFVVPEMQMICFWKVEEENDELRSSPDAGDLGSHPGLRSGVRTLPGVGAIRAEPAGTEYRAGISPAG